MVRIHKLGQSICSSVNVLMVVLCQKGSQDFEGVSFQILSYKYLEHSTFLLLPSEQIECACYFPMIDGGVRGYTTTFNLR